MIKVNLVPRELLEREIQKQRITQVSIVGGVLAVLVLLLSGVHFYRAFAAEIELKDLNREHDKLAKVVAQVEEVEKTANAVRVRLGVINGLLKGRPLYPYFMTDLMATLPPGVWLTSLATSAKDSNGLSVSIGNATANSSAGVSQWLRNFEASGNFEEPKLSGVAVTEKGDGREFTFSITTAYRSPNL